MGFHYLIFMERNLENRKKLMVEKSWIMSVWIVKNIMNKCWYFQCSVDINSSDRGNIMMTGYSYEYP